MILDDVYDEPRHGIQSKESVVVVPCCHTLDITVDAGLGADSEKEGRNVFHLKDTFLCQFGNEKDEILFRRSRALENGDPLLETFE